MQYEVSMPMTMNHDLSATPHYSQQNLYVPNGNSRIKSETGSERGVSPHTSDHSSRYSSQTPQNPLGYTQLASNLTNGMSNPMRYPSPSQQQQQSNMMPLIHHTYHPNAPPDQSYQQAQLGAVQQVQPDQSPMDGGRISAGSTGLPKAFACSTCSKGFARRSDLARHGKNGIRIDFSSHLLIVVIERIHSGVRPHVCDHPGCGKQFIQRSALTVHSRVHTGEKPHMCERCGKVRIQSDRSRFDRLTPSQPFSDSSSLARHRRIHSGKRPYKCPYADCQKTFTRRTTLTRHQNHHTGTIEESEAATAAALASRVSLANARSRGSDEEDGFGSTDGKSPMPQHADRPPSVSPATGMNGVAGIQRNSSDYYMNAMNGGMAVPPHLRPEMQPSPRSQSPAQYPMPVNGQQHRPSLTSNPSSSGYNPPQILEPTPANGQQTTASGSNSPHMAGSLGWQSPHNGINGNQQNEYPYPDPNGGYNVNAQMYYQQQSVPRPHSTGPMDYHNQMRGQEIWHQQ